MNAILIILPLIAAILSSLGTYLLGISGILNTGITKKKEERTASDLLVNEALTLVNALSAQIKDLRLDKDDMEKHQLQETQVLRERIKLLETRVSELELENAKLKSQLYDAKIHPTTLKLDIDPQVRDI